MDYTVAHLVYFSPTHTSRTVARSVGEGLGMERILETDLTLDRGTSEIDVADVVAVIAVPVYAGRVAPVALERVRRLRERNTPVVLLAVYGNRDYEDALVELRDAVVPLGFMPLAAGAFIGEHSYSRPAMPIAEGRPDDADMNIAFELGKEAAAKLVSSSGLNGLPPLTVKGNVPYRYVAPSTPAAPVVREDACTACLECVDMCPTAAITVADDGSGRTVTDPQKCIKCCACVKQCPVGARVFDTPYTAMLHAKCSVRREPELFI